MIWFYESSTNKHMYYTYMLKHANSKSTTYRWPPCSSIFGNTWFIPPSLGKRNLNESMVPLYFSGFVVAFVVVAFSGSSGILAMMTSPAATVAVVGVVVTIRIKQCMSDIFGKGLATEFFQGWLERFGPSRIHGLLLSKRFSFTFHQGLTTSTRCHGRVVGFSWESLQWDFTLCHRWPLSMCTAEWWNDCFKFHQRRLTIWTPSTSTSIRSTR